MMQQREWLQHLPLIKGLQANFLLQSKITFIFNFFLMTILMKVNFTPDFIFFIWILAVTWILVAFLIASVPLMLDTLK